MSDNMKIMELQEQLKTLKAQAASKEKAAEDAIIQGDDPDGLMAEVSSICKRVDMTKKVLDGMIKNRPRVSTADYPGTPWEEKEKKRIVEEREARLEKRRKIVADRQKRDTGSTAIFRDPENVLGNRDNRAVEVETAEEAEPNVFAERDAAADAADRGRF